MTWRVGLLVVVAIVVTACVPTLDETITIEADGSGQFTATWFVTRDDFGRGGVLDDAEETIGDLSFEEAQELLRSGRPEELIIGLSGDADYRIPPRATLEPVVEDDRVGIVYREQFSSLAHLASWRRGSGPLGALSGVADPGSGRLSLLALWGLQVDESADEVTLTITPTRAFADGRLLGTGEEGAETPARLRLAIGVDGEVVESNADRVEGDLYVWEPTIDGVVTEQIASSEPVRLTWQWTPPAEEASRTTTIALVLIAVGALIGLIAFARYLWRRRLTRPLHYVDE